FGVGGHGSDLQPDHRGCDPPGVGRGRQRGDHPAHRADRRHRGARPALKGSDPEARLRDDEETGDLKLASLMAQLGTRLGKHRVLWWIARLYPPFVGAGIRVRATPGLESIDVELPLTWWNRNY